MKTRHGIMVTAAVILLQGCVSAGGSKPPTDTFVWDNNKSLALNVMRSIKKDNKLEDTAVPERVKTSLILNGEVRGTLTALSSMGDLGSTMNMGTASSLGLGMLSWLAKSDPMKRPYIAYYAPIASTTILDAGTVQKLESHAAKSMADSLLKSITMDTNEYPNKGRLAVLDSIQLSDGPSQSSIELTESWGKMLTAFKYTLVAEAIGVCEKIKQICPTKSLVIRITFDGNSMAPVTWPDNLPENAFLFLKLKRLEPRDPKRQLTGVPRVYDQQNTYLFIKPSA